MASKNKKDIFNRLEEEGKKKGLSPRFIEASQKIFNIQYSAEQRIDQIKPSLQKVTIDKRIEHGLPLLGFNDLTLDWTLVKDVFNDVAACFADYSDLFGILPEHLRKSKSRITLPKRMVKAWYERAELPHTTAMEDVGEYLLMEAIIQATLRPFLVSHARVLIGLINQERWRRDYCPICGGTPDFSFLDKELGSRWLLCSRCDTKWLFLRLKCPYCGNQKQADLAYFIDDKGVYRLYVCDQCHKYIKAVDLRATQSEVLLPLERILTLDLDRQAQEKGYQPG